MSYLSLHICYLPSFSTPSLLVLYLSTVHPLLSPPATMLITPQFFFSIIHHSAISVTLIAIPALAALPAFARVCSGCWGEGGVGGVHVLSLNSSTKRLLSVIWLAEIRGLSVVVRRWLLQRTRQLHCHCQSPTGWSSCLESLKPFCCYVL